MNKRGTDKILSIYWFAILVLVAGGVFAMVYSFYGTPYDVREIESYLLANRVADCISKGGRIDSSFFNGEEFNSEIQKTILKECNLNFNVEEGYGSEAPQYFFEVNFYKVEDLSNSAFYLYAGNMNLGADCSIQKESKKDYDKLSKCVERRLYALDSSNNQYLIKIVSGVSKSEKNVKL